MKRASVVLALALAAAGANAEAPNYRLYEELVAFLHNPDGKEFALTLDARDINHIAAGPSELLVKVYAPDGQFFVREVVPDDGVTASSSGGTMAEWHHEAWYYATRYSRGLAPMVRWSSFSDPKRLAAMPKRTFTCTIQGRQKGVYRMALTGSPDDYVTFKTDPSLSCGVAGGPDVQHGMAICFVAAPSMCQRARRVSPSASWNSTCRSHAPPRSRHRTGRLCSRATRRKALPAPRSNSRGRASTTTRC
jgi:hypothetical protein